MSNLPMVRDPNRNADDVGPDGGFLYRFTSRDSLPDLPSVIAIEGGPKPRLHLCIHDRRSAFLPAAVKAMDWGGTNSNYATCLGAAGMTR